MTAGYKLVLIIPLKGLLQQIATVLDLDRVLLAAGSVRETSWASRARGWAFPLPIVGLKQKVIIFDVSRPKRDTGFIAKFPLGAPAADQRAVASKSSPMILFDLVDVVQSWCRRCCGQRFRRRRS